jgi:hypothetical protein
MKKMIFAGIASLALAGALSAAPMTAAAKSVVSQLTVTEQSAANQLAESIILTVMKAQAEVQGATADQAKVHIQLAVQAVIRNSGASPIVAAAALEIAQTKLAASGALACVVNPKDSEQNCNPAGMALASLSALLQSIIETAPAAGDAPGGAIPLGSPLALTPPNSGISDYR